MIINSIPSAQQSLRHDYIEILCNAHGISSVKIGSIDQLRKQAQDKGVGGGSGVVSATG